MQPISAADAKGFFRSLFDFNFTSLITTKIIKFLYILIVVVYSLAAVAFFITLIAKGGAGGFVVAVIFVPVIYLIYLIFARVWMEFLIVIFKIGEDLHAIRVGGGGLGGGTLPQPPPPPRV